MGWIVALAGTAINLCLGVLYTWSIINKQLTKSVADGGLNWSDTDAGRPYMVAVLAFALMTVVGGRMQDKIGPRIAATIGGVLVGVGMLLSGQAAGNVTLVTIGFGVLTGAGIGFAYASATPPAVKWFPAKMTGLVAGLVVAGFGLASAYTAPLTKWLLATQGVSGTFTTLGVAFLVAIVVLAQLMRNPPAGYIAPTAAAPGASAAPKARDYSWLEMLKTGSFWMLWVMYLVGGGVGLMIIGKLSTMVGDRVKIDALVYVVVLAVGNAGGRVLAGMLSDTLGRTKTLLLAFLVQAALMLALLFLKKGVMDDGALTAVLLGVVALVGANYGANLAVFPSVTKDYFGLKNFGVNYGFVFTSWGVGGLLGTYLMGRIKDATGTYDTALWVACGALVLVAAMTFIAKPPKARESAAA